MPTINFKKKDIEKLLKRKLTIKALDDHLSLVKGELKGYDEGTDDMRVEIGDSNRPDLWSPEGIARQIGIKLRGGLNGYPFFKPSQKVEHEIIVSKEIKGVRPFISACLSYGSTLDEETLVQIIQSQEKLSEIFGRKRQTISIGIYRLNLIKFPVYYRAVKPEEISFVPLGLESKMNLKDILYVHPKGKEYGSILKGFDRYPVLMDKEDRVLSFPPIINSRDMGEVKIGDKDLFVEVTGTDLRLVILTLNILAVNLSDRGAKIKPVTVRYPYNTEFGKNVTAPFDFTRPISLSLNEFERVLGEKPGKAEVARYLKEYGYKVKAGKAGIKAICPPYRDDIMHTVDVIEDLALSKGYHTFKPLMPTTFTVGALSEVELFSDRIRNHLIGLGFQEVISNILTSREEVMERMGLNGKSPEIGPLEIENVMSLSYSVVRNWVLPSLLKVEAASSKSFYPHKIFEVGEVAIRDNTQETGSRTQLKAGALISHTKASFSEIHSFLDTLFFYLSIKYQLVQMNHPTFIDGRVGRIIVKGKNIGFLGEVHPKILEDWQIGVPCSAFEFTLDELLKPSL